MNKHANVTKTTLPVVGMNCAACAANVGKVLGKHAGVLESNVNFASNTAYICYDRDVCTLEDLREDVRNAGYDLMIVQNEHAKEEFDAIQQQKYRVLKNRTVWAVLLNVPLMVLGMCYRHVGWIGYVEWLLATPIVFVLGGDFFRNAWRQLRHRTSNMDTLVAVSTGIAYVFSLFNLLFPSYWLSRGIEPHRYFEASGGIIAFILLGRLLEERAKKNTTTAIRKLIGLQPHTVSVKRGNELKTISLSQLRKDDLVVVKPGERIAVDGTITEGASYVDESMLTGEPIPVYKEAGMKVYTGTLNQKGAFTVVTEQAGEHTMLAKIIRLVQEAQGSKAPVQKLADSVAARFVPTIMVVSLITFLCWWLWGGDNGFTYGLLAMVTVLIIACPCALGLATPTAIMVGIGKGAERGILIKNAEGLEMACKVDTVVLDKTGTLTSGNPVVTDVKWKSGCEHFQSFFYSLEKCSEHPLAEAVADYWADWEQLAVRSFEAVAGKGVRGVFDGAYYYAGNKELLQEHGIELDEALEQWADRWEAEAKTVLWFADAHTSLGVVAVTDELKPSSKEAVGQLLRMGIEVHVLTGDHEIAAKQIAGQVAATHYRAKMQPHEKADYVKLLQAQGRKVAMVGDGINDSAALALADLSIAMGKGSDIAIDTAMVTLLSSDLWKVPEMIRLSRLTVRTIHQNLFWAFIYNLLSVPVAAGILYPLNGFLLNPMIGSMAMAFSSVSVVCNSLALKRKKIGNDLNEVAKVTTQKNEHTEPIKTDKMKKEFKVSGMMCPHCRAHVEKALNRVEGVSATVTLDPPVAIVESEQGPVELADLQAAVNEHAGDYRLTEL